jgi:hypothetical protein
MQSRHESSSFNERDWNYVSVQSPLGQVRLARRLPSAGQFRRSGKIIRRSVLSNLLDLAVKPVRSRRSP